MSDKKVTRRIAITKEKNYVIFVDDGKGEKEIIEEFQYHQRHGRKDNITGTWKDEHGIVVVQESDYFDTIKVLPL